MDPTDDQFDDQFPFDENLFLNVPQYHDPGLEDHGVQGLQELDGRINEVATASLNGHIDDTLTQSLQTHLTPREHRTLDDVATGRVDAGEEHQAVQNAANLMKRVRDQDTSEDKIQHVPKKPRILNCLQDTQEQELEQTLATGTSNAGSSAMYQAQALQSSTPQSVGANTTPVLDHSASATLQGALNQFYDTAFQWFGMATPAPANVLCAPLCNIEIEPSNSVSAIYTARQSAISKLLRDEIEKGENLADNQFVESFAKVMLDQVKFKCLCPCCLTLFCDAIIFTKHLIKREGSFRCLYRCGASFTRSHSLRRHMKLLHGRQIDESQIEPNLFRCTEPGCDDHFFSRCSLLKHAHRRHGSAKGPCKVCRIVFNTKAEMDAHLLSAHGIIEGQPLPFACDVEGCNVRCRTEVGLQQHKSRMHCSEGPSHGQ